MARGAAPLFIVGVLAACGARTALDDSGGTSAAASSSGGGSGAANSGTSSSGSVGGFGGSSSSSTGVGGSVLGCLSVTGAPTRVPIPPALVPAQPQLIVPAGSTTQVALVVGLAPFSSPLGVPGEVAVTGFDPWGDWPPPIAMMTPIATVALPSRFATGESRVADAFAVLVDLDDQTDSPGLAAAVDARIDGTATFVPISSVHQDPLFVAAPTAAVVFGSQKIDPNGAADSHVQIVANHEVGGIVEREACGTPPLAGAAISRGGKVLYALSSQDTSGACMSQPAPADARRVSIGLAEMGGLAVGTASYGPYYPSYGAITALAWSPTSSGSAWFFERSVATGDPPSQLVDGRIEKSGSGDLSPQPLPVVGTDGLAVAGWRDDDIFVVMQNQGAVRSFVYHRATGGPDEGDYLDITPSGQLLGAYAAAAAPSRKQWIIAWIEREPDGTFALFVARLACDA